MKHIIILIVCSMFIFSTVVVYAAPVGNVAKANILKKGLIIKDEASKFGVAIEPEVDIVFDRNLEDQAGDTKYGFYGGKTGLIFGNRAVLYGICGAANAEQKFRISGREIEWETETDLVWGAGATLIIYEKEIDIREKGILTIGIDGRYRRSDLDTDKIIVDGTNYNLPDATISGTKFDSSEWQVALGVSYQMDKLIPYAGVKYSDIRGKAETTISATEYSRDFETEHKTGIFAGCDILITDSVSAYAEGRFIDETALSAGATIRF